MPFYSMGFVIALASIAFFYKAGEDEMGSGLPWAGLSAIVSTAILFWWSSGVLPVLFGQLGLLAGITAYRVWRDPH